MPMYFWVGSQLGESERKLLREAGGSSESLLICSIHQIWPRGASSLRETELDIDTPGPMGPKPDGKFGSCRSPE